MGKQNIQAKDVYQLQVQPQLNDWTIYDMFPITKFAYFIGEASFLIMAASADEHQDHATSYPFSRKLQVLFLASEWGSSKGGLSTINRELAVNVAKYCVADVSYFVPRCNDDDKKAAHCLGINLLEAKEVPGVDELQWLCSFPLDLPVDVVVGHGVKLGPQAEFIRRSHKCKWFQVVHTAPEQLGMYKKYSDPILIGEKKHETAVKLCEMADCVVSIGPKLLEAFQAYLCSCNKDFFNFTPGIFREFSEVKQVADRTGKFRVLLFGRGDAEDFELKGCDIAAKAVNALDNTHLIFVGAPENMLEEVKNRFLKCGIHANDLTVRSFQLCRESLKSSLCEADVAIMPSRTEGFGLTGLEALSAGLPVLVSSNSGFGDALSKVLFGSAFVIESEKPELWAEKIKDVMGKTRKKRLEESLKLRTFYADEYSWETQCKELIRKMIIVVHGKYCLFC